MPSVIWHSRVYGQRRLGNQDKIQAQMFMVQDRVQAQQLNGYNKGTVPCLMHASGYPIVQ